MSNIDPQNPAWVPIPQIEKDTVAEGGTGGTANMQAVALMQCDAFLLKNSEEQAERINGQGANISQVESQLGTLGDQVVAVQGDITLLQEGQNANQLTFGGATGWTQLQARSAATVGQAAQVINDPGTHTDPVSGAVVPNNGTYSATGTAWAWLRADALGLKANRTEVLSMVDNTSDRGSYAYALAYPDGRFALAVDREGNVVTRVPRFSGFPAAAYGDSTTFGADLTDPARERWSRLLEQYTGKQIWNFGVSGERSDEIQFREGSLTISASVPSGSINATGNTTILFDSTDPLRASTSAQQVVLITETNERIPGRITANGANRLFGRAIPGSAIPTTKVRMINVSGAKTNGKLLFLAQGVNDEGMIVAGTRTANDVKMAYEAAITSLSPDNPTYVIWGMLDRGLQEVPTQIVGRTVVPESGTWTVAPSPAVPSFMTTVNVVYTDIAGNVLSQASIPYPGAGDASGTGPVGAIATVSYGSAIGDIIRDVETWLAQRFGPAFCPVRPFLSSAYALVMAAQLQPGFTPTAADSNSVSVGVVPPSFRVGPTSVHLNVLGHKLQAWFMYQHLLARGIV